MPVASKAAARSTSACCKNLIDARQAPSPASVYRVRACFACCWIRTHRRRTSTTTASLIGSRGPGHIPIASRAFSAESASATACVGRGPSRAASSRIRSAASACPRRQRRTTAAWSRQCTGFERLPALPVRSSTRLSLHVGTHRECLAWHALASSKRFAPTVYANVGRVADARYSLTDRSSLHLQLFREAAGISSSCVSTLRILPSHRSGTLRKPPMRSSTGLWRGGSA